MIAARELCDGKFDCPDQSDEERELCKGDSNLVSCNYHEKCVTDLDLRSEMIFFESLFTTFKGTTNFGGTWDSSKN